MSVILGFPEISPKKIRWSATVKNPLTPLSTLGIGSVPFTKGENSCERIFQEWDIPFWPQYPRRSLRENMIFQFLSSFPGLEVSEETVSFNETVYQDQAEGYRRRRDQAFLEGNFLSFGPPPEWALGYSQMKALLDENRFSEKRVVKLQVTGPETAWRSFFTGRVSRRNAERILEDLRQTLTAAGLAQVERIRSHRRVPLIFIDEPLRSDDLQHLERMVQAFKNFEALVGLHICSNLDWEGFENLAIDFFHFDLSASKIFNLTHRLFLKSFLKKGRTVVWGAVPTTPDLGLKVQDFLPIIIFWLNEISDRKLSIEEILERSLLAPACGMGALSSAQEEVVYQSIKMTKKSLDSIRRGSILLD